MHQALILFHFRIRLICMQEGVSIFFCCILILIFFLKESLLLISRVHHLQTFITSEMADLGLSMD